MWFVATAFWCWRDPSNSCCCCVCVCACERVCVVLLSYFYVGAVLVLVLWHFIISVTLVILCNSSRVSILMMHIWSGVSDWLCAIEETVSLLSSLMCECHTYFWSLSSLSSTRIREGHKKRKHSFFLRYYTGISGNGHIFGVKIQSKRCDLHNHFCTIPINGWDVFLSCCYMTKYFQLIILTWFYSLIYFSLQFSGLSMQDVELCNQWLTSQTEQVI